MGGKVFGELGYFIWNFYSSLVEARREENYGVAMSAIVRSAGTSPLTNM